MKHAWMIATLVALLFCTACADSGSATPPAGSTAAAPAPAAPAVPVVPEGQTKAAINAMCPMMGSAVEPDGGSTQYAGHVIGFCCKKCVAKFAALDDAGKLNALAKNGTTLPN